MEFNYKTKALLVILVIIFGTLLYNNINGIDIVGEIFFVSILVIFYLFDLLLNVKYEKTHYYYVIIIAFFGFLFGYLQFSFIYLDKVLHLVGGFFLASILYYFGRRFGYSKSRSLWMSVVLSVIIIVGYEVFEFILDTFYGFGFRGVYNISENNTLNLILDKNLDTLLDVLFGVLGSISYVIYKRKS